MSALDAGYAETASGVTLDRFCGSGITAANFGAATIMAGLEDVVVAGGAEMMSSYKANVSPNRSPFMDGGNTRLRASHPQTNQGVAADAIATLEQIPRRALDELAAESQRRAAAAIAEGRFKEQIVPIVKKTRKGEVTVDTDEHVKPGTTVEKLAAMRPAFKKDGGTVTAGNASGINDGAAFLVLADAEAAQAANTKPLARLVSYAVAGVPNHIMGEGPIPATKIAMEKAGMGLDSIDVIESNEAFAAQAIAVARGLELDMKKVNPNGGAIALGHPIGCSGAALAVKAIHELHRTGGRYALVTMCVGGGQGIAAVFERL